MLLYIFCLIIATVSCAPADFQWSRIETLFTFGDSYTTQNLDLATLKYPCAECTSAGGINWVEALVALQPSIKAYWDLAYNSAPIANRLVGQNNSQVIDVTTQITRLFPTHFLADGMQWDPEKTLYMIWVGINDIDLTADWPADTDQLDAALMDQYATLIDFLYKHQAQQIVLLNVPPIDRSPMWQRQGVQAVTRIRDRVTDFNRQWLALCERLKQEVPHLYAFDAWSVFTAILDHPGRYGFKNVTSYWDPPSSTRDGALEDYFWWNDLHPTSKVHSFIAESLHVFLEYQSSSSQ